MNAATETAMQVLNRLEEMLYTGPGDGPIDADVSVPPELFMRNAAEEADSLGYKLNFVETDSPTIDVDDADGVFGATYYNRTGSRRAGNIYISGGLCRKMPALGRYVLRHEIGAEAEEYEENGAPDPERHAYLEMHKVLEYLKGIGDMEAYLAGLALHYVRNKSGNTETFNDIKDYVDAAVEEYSTSKAYAKTFRKYVKRIERSMKKGYIVEDEDDLREFSTFRDYFEKGKRFAEEGIGYVRDWIGEQLDNIAGPYRPAEVIA